MGHAVWPVLLIIGSNVFYHSFSKSASQDINPFAALVAVYLIAAAASFVTYLLILLLGDGHDTLSLAQTLRRMNVANYLLGIAIIGLEGGYLYLYKTGWSMSVGPVVSYSGTFIGLLAVGALCYHEKVTLRQAIGLVLCLGGIALISLKPSGDRHTDATPAEQAGPSSGADGK